MLRSFTVFLFFCFVMLASSAAQQRVLISTGPNPGVHFADTPAPLVAPAFANLPYITPVQEEPKSLVLVPMDTVFLTQVDQSDSSFAITENGEVVAFTCVIDYPAGGGGLGYTINGAAQFFPPMPGNVSIDTLVVFAFKLTSRPNIKGNMYVLPVLAPTGINWTTYTGFRRDFDEFKQISGVPELYTIHKDTINNRLEGTNLRGVVLPTPDFRVPANTAFGLIFLPEQEADSIRILAGYEWDTKVRPTGAMYTRTNNGNRKDSIRTFFGNLQWTAQAPPPLTNRPIRQNLDLRLFGTFDAVTSVRPEPSYEAAGVTLGTSYPNPANQEAHIRFSIEKAAPVTLRLTNTLGQVIQKATFDDRAPGSYVWDITTAELPNGTYFYTLTTGATTITRTLQVNR